MPPPESFLRNWIGSRQTFKPGGGKSGAAGKGGCTEASFAT